ncbi:vWA domain-containing protein [Thiosulfativibrio zosterae]|uniref:VWFA domain-containing protein n=1 Tax=Thiosulfativibrio zosterae TaxID=2675053 RepID=A0A6F8PJT5_9GAMM|nr:VWA domain-containing protein [Thiosulfativibrio zosterae]BBP42359.1 hypothetical protein THMIRHAT_01050 [Thiosulfativibrio zosterae]
MTEWLLRLSQQAQSWQEWAAISFAQPDVFWLGLLLPLLWLSKWVGVWQVRSDWQADLGATQNAWFRHTLIEQAFALKSAQKQPGLVSFKPNLATFWRQTLLQILRVLVVLMVLVAAAQPQKITVFKEPQPQAKTVRDLVFVVESSASFLLPDYQVQGQATPRMTVVKQVLDQFMAGLSGNRFGLVLYAEQAYTLMPLTNDLTTARLMLQRLRPYLAGRTDEAMGEALGLALRQAEQDTPSTQKRVVVLISDGLSRPSRLPINQVIEYAQAMNLPIYTIGVGAGSAEADQRIYRGLLYQPLESNSLKTLAEQTLGQYFQVTSGQDLQKVLQTIDQSEGVAVAESLVRKQISALFELPLALGLLSLFIYTLLRLIWQKHLKVLVPSTPEPESSHVG